MQYLGCVAVKFLQNFLNFFRTVWVRISLYIIEGGKHMELEELYDRIYRYCYFHTGRILSGLKTGHSSDRQAEAGKVLQFSALSDEKEHDKIRIKNEIDIEKLPRNFYKPRGGISMFLLSL